MAACPRNTAEYIKNKNRKIGEGVRGRSGGCFRASLSGRGRGGGLCAAALARERPSPEKRQK